MIKSWIARDDSNVTDNGTFILLAAQKIHWNSGAVFILMLTIVTFISNFLILLIFLRHYELRSSFTVYIMALLLGNALYCITDDIFVLIEHVFDVFPLGQAVCTFRLYTGWVLTGVQPHMHVLITVNRIWAIAFPISYRQRHTVSIAVKLVVLAVVYVHVICVPGVMLDAMYYRHLLEVGGCNINSEPYGVMVWQSFTMVLIYDLPIFFMAAAYPFLWRKRKKQKATVKHSDALPMAEPIHATVTKKRGTTKGFLVLTALTISVVICWTPYNMYYTVGGFIDVDIPVMRQVGFYLYSIQPLLDPLLILITMKDLRTAIKNAFYALHKI